MAEGSGAPLAVRELPALFDRVHAALASRRQVIDDLNVFPIPDGDTGTNMTLTVRAGLEALREAQDLDVDAARSSIRGTLRGARGNSGVILSQVVRAVIEVVTGHARVDAPVYAAALARARDLAYEAVAEPVEGTILTAIGAAAGAAEAAADRGDGLVATSAAALRATAAAVEETREQLEVLREAGVVDAGARGFEVLLGAVHEHLTGDAYAAREDVVPQLARTADGSCRPSLSSPYEVQYLLDAADAVAVPLRRRLEQLGESVVVVAAGDLLNVHVHTAEIGPAIEVGLEHGRPSAIEVTNLGEQLEARGAARDPGRVDPAQVPLGAVAVLDGSGLRAIARRRGAEVVQGSAGRLPSVEALLDAVLAARAEHVLVLPGHRNGVAAAEGAAALAARDHGVEVDVVTEADAPPAVLAALAVLDLDAPAAQVVEDVRAAAAAMRTGEVVDAVRDAVTPVGPVRRGQPLAVVDGDVVAACATPLAALYAVLTALSVEEAEVVTVLVGAGVDEHTRTDALGLVATTTDAEVEVVDAGQRPARFCIGVE